MQQEARNTLLIVDDEENILKSLSRLLRNENYQVLCANSGHEALKLFATHNIRVVLCDQRMPNMGGSQFLGLIKQLYPATVRMLLSGYTDFPSLTDAINYAEINKFLSKPWNDEELKSMIAEAFRKQQFLENNKQLLEAETHQALMITDPKNIIESINYHFSEITGYNHNEAINHRLLLIDQEADEERITNIVKKNGQWTGQVNMRHSNNQIFNVWLTVSAIPDVHGTIKQLIYTFKNITEENTQPNRE